MDISPLPPAAIGDAHRRIKPYIHHTPVLESSLLNGWLGHRVLFKAEGLQKIGAFKARGALNALLSLRERGALPPDVVAFSSGNHAQAVAFAATLLGIRATIIIPGFTSAIKQQATRGYGADVVLTETRQEAEALVHRYIDRGFHFLHPSDDDDIIAGQGTALYEALQDHPAPDAVFAACGGGGLLAGSVLAAQLLKPELHLFGAEPLQANDAAQSLRTGHIVRLPTTPDTIADGARTLAISERTFYYLKQLGGMIEVPETAIIYWTQWLAHLLKTAVEPTAAMAMAASAQWMEGQPRGKTVLVILSGGNIAPDTQRVIWQENHLERLPGNYSI